MKGAEAVQSTFLVELEKLLDAALQVPEIQGIILNPWNRTIQLDKPLLRIIKG
ncbi:MAG: SseB family protein [Faecalibacterium sp.]